MPTVKGLAVKIIQEKTADVLRSVAAMPADKLTWKPLELGSDVLENMLDLAGLAYFAGAILKAQAMPEIDPARRAQFMAENDTVAKATATLEYLTKDLVAAIKSFPDDKLDDTVTLPFGGGIVKTFAEIMMTQYWHLAYHEGQISYIQLLYGDTEMH